MFLLRAVLHDWSDKLATMILRQLRESAVIHPYKTSLLIADYIISHTCPDEQVGSISKRKSISLLPTVDSSNSMLYAVDMGVSSGVTCHERY